jgi:hypothetical protein
LPRPARNQWRGGGRGARATTRRGRGGVASPATEGGARSGDASRERIPLRHATPRRTSVGEQPCRAPRSRLA